MGCDALVFGSMGDIAEVVAADLAALGLRVVSVPFKQNTLRDEWGYGRCLHKAFIEFNPAMIFPVGCQIAAARSCPELPLMPMAPARVLEMLDSKVLTFEFAASLGIPLPERFGVPLPPGVVPSRDVIFKRDCSFGGSGVHRPLTMESLQNLVARETGRPCLVERYIEGEDVSVDCVLIDGKFRAGCYKTVGKCQSQGPSSARERISFPEIENLAEHLLRAAGYRGVCGMDFRVDLSGKPFLLECNPRFTGGLSTQIASGFHIPQILWKA